MSLAEAAAHLLAARRAGVAFAGFPASLSRGDEGAGYAIQDAVYDALSGGRAIAGHKVGCTTAVMQAYMGIDHPCSGVVLAETVHRSPAGFPCSGHRRLGVECELAVRLGDDLEPAAVIAAIEVVDDRYVDFRSLETATLVADNFFGAGCVLGREHDPAGVGDLARVSASMEINGTEAGHGVGAHILGDPLEALRWLKASRAARGRPLRPGEIVLLGSVVETRWVGAGDDVRVTSDLLGDVTVRFLP